MCLAVQDHFNFQQETLTFLNDNVGLDKNFWCIIPIHIRIGFFDKYLRSLAFVLQTSVRFIVESLLVSNTGFIKLKCCDFVRACSNLWSQVNSLFHEISDIGDSNSVIIISWKMFLLHSLCSIINELSDIVDGTDQPVINLLISVVLYIKQNIEKVDSNQISSFYTSVEIILNGIKSSYFREQLVNLWEL